MDLNDLFDDARIEAIRAQWRAARTLDERLTELVARGRWPWTRTWAWIERARLRQQWPNATDLSPLDERIRAVLHGASRVWHWLGYPTLTVPVRGAVVISIGHQNGHCSVTLARPTGRCLFDFEMTPEDFHELAVLAVDVDDYECPSCREGRP